MRHNQVKRRPVFVDQPVFRQSVNTVCGEQRFRRRLTYIIAAVTSRTADLIFVNAIAQFGQFSRQLLTAGEGFFFGQFGVQNNIGFTRHIFHVAWHVSIQIIRISFERTVYIPVVLLPAVLIFFHEIGLDQRLYRFTKRAFQAIIGTSQFFDLPVIIIMFFIFFLLSVSLLAICNSLKKSDRGLS